MYKYTSEKTWFPLTGSAVLTYFGKWDFVEADVDHELAHGFYIAPGECVSHFVPCMERKCTAATCHGGIVRKLNLTNQKLHCTLSVLSAAASRHTCSSDWLDCCSVCEASVCIQCMYINHLTHVY